MNLPLVPAEEVLRHQQARASRQAALAAREEVAAAEAAEPVAHEEGPPAPLPYGLRELPPLPPGANPDDYEWVEDENDGMALEEAADDGDAGQGTGSE
jgi:hypothetical protein